jgi:hypothetical protein
MVRRDINAALPRTSSQAAVLRNLARKRPHLPSRDRGFGPDRAAPTENATDRKHKFVMRVTAALHQRCKDPRQGFAKQQSRRCAMTDITLPCSFDGTLSQRSKGRRIYHFKMPFHLPGIAIGWAIARLKQLGVWEKLPQAMRKKAKSAKASWSHLAITEKDLDSIPDEDWKVIAARLDLKWEMR